MKNSPMGNFFWMEYLQTSSDSLAFVSILLAGPNLDKIFGPKNMTASNHGFNRLQN